MNTRYVIAGVLVAIAAVSVGVMASTKGQAAHAQVPVAANFLRGSSVPATITVTGVASQAVRLSSVQVQVGFTLTDSTPSALAHDEQTSVGMIRSDLAALHVAPGDWVIGYPNISTQTGTEYTAQMNFVVMIPDSASVIKVMGAVADIATLPDASNVYTSETNWPTVSAALRARLFKAALLDARAQAAALAGEAGGRVGSVVSISTGRPQTSDPSGAYGSAGVETQIGGVTSAAGAGNSPGSDEVATAVTVTYALLSGSAPA